MRQLKLIISLLLIFSLLIVSQGINFAQKPAPQKTETPEQDDSDIVRITTNLVQLDVVVTDSKGNQVTDLKSENFEMFEDGRPQQITNFSFVSNEVFS